MHLQGWYYPDDTLFVSVGVDCKLDLLISKDKLTNQVTIIINLGLRVALKTDNIVVNISLNIYLKYW